MTEPAPPPVDILKLLPQPDPSSPQQPRLSPLASRIQGSQILRIAGEIAAMKAGGATVCNLTVGDYAPAEFPIPKRMMEENLRAFREGATNYPPTSGLPELRDAVCELYAARFGLRYPREGCLITAGSRAIVYAFFRALVDAGDVVINPTPSWNVHYYAELVSATQVKVASSPEHGFLPTREGLEEVVRGARALVLCSPGNPTGTMFQEDQLAAICDLILEENARRGAHERPLFLLYDQVYWPLTHGGREHIHPLTLRPQMAPYTVFVDGVSKAFAGTGLRVGWALGPPDLIAGMGRITSHAGAWAPKPSQLATVRFLADEAVVSEAFASLQGKVEARLRRLTDGLEALRDAGLPISFIPPQGALYITFKVDVVGMTTPEGKVLEDNEDIRQYLLQAAGMGIVPFEAFGVEEATRWFRLSVGAVSDADIDALMPRLEAALRALS